MGAYTVLLVGLTEELIFRGFLMSRLARGLGDTDRAWLAAAVLTALLFGLVHFQHGVLSVLNGTVLGLLFGLVYLKAGRSLWVVILAHSACDTVRVLEYFAS